MKIENFPMIPVTDLRSGVVFTDGKDIFAVISYQHKKLGRGAANIKVRVKDLRKDTTMEKNFLSGAKVQEVSIDKRQAQFLYQQRNDFVFMDSETFDSLIFPKEKLANYCQFFTAGMEVSLLLYQNELISIDLPTKMEFTVKETTPMIKGNTVTNIFKDAYLDNNLKVKVPLFIRTGDRVIIDTKKGEYVGKVRHQV